MKLLGTTQRRMAAAVVTAGLLVGGSIGLAAATSSAPPSNGVSNGHGINEYGMTRAYFKGTALKFTYSKGFYCDTSVSSKASSGCEAGANFKKPPAKQYDPLYITVPLGFSRGMNMIQCPANLVCVDHPGTIDLRRLEPALKPLYPKLTYRQLRMALRNFPTPEHDHFVTTAFWGKPEWWDVKVIGVTSPSVFKDIRAHKSFAYIKRLIRNGNKHVTPVIPTNLFLYFSVQ